MRSSTGFNNVALDRTRYWYQHPSVVFCAPFFILLLAPYAYNVLLSYTSPSSLSSSTSYFEPRIQEIVTLFDEIYTIMANMTFIPHTSIKRGPHNINFTEIECKRDPAILRLVELLPYVDTLELQETDWLQGGEFIDYRSQYHISLLCNPLGVWGERDLPGNPYRIALTHWGYGGWNNDRVWVLDYDILGHEIRIFDGDGWMEMWEGKLPPDVDAGSSWLEHEIEFNWNSWAWRGDGDDRGRALFDASSFLSKLRGALKSGATSPWETSNHEKDWDSQGPVIDGLLGRKDWGVKASAITKLLRKNGWPDTFDADQFNADFIRASHEPSPHGHAEDAHKRLQEVLNMANFGVSPSIAGERDARLTQQERFLAEVKREHEDLRWFYKWKLQQTEWEIEREQVEIAELRKEIAHLCPDGLCYAPEDAILWEFRNIEKEYLDVQYRDVDIQAKCQEKVDYFAEWAVPDPDRFKNCAVQLELEKHWFLLAYSQAKAAALDHCAKNGKMLLAPLTPENRALVTIDQHEKSIPWAEEFMSRMEIWKDMIPKHADQAWGAFNMTYNFWSSRPSFYNSRIKWLKKLLAEGNSKKLWCFLEEQDCWNEE